MQRVLKKSLFIPMVLAIVLSGLSLSAAAALEGTWAIKDCRIVTMAGKEIKAGTVVVEDGLIREVGLKVNIPKTAKIIDGKGLTVYPGLIDVLNQSLLKYPAQKFDMSKVYSGQYTDKDRGYTPEEQALAYIKLNKSIVRRYHKAGITAVQVMPVKGIFTGSASVLILGPDSKTKSTLIEKSANGIQYAPSSFGYPGSLMGVYAFIKQTLADANYYVNHKRLWTRNPKGIKRIIHDAKMEIISGFAAKREPVLFLCKNQYDIRRSIQIGKKYRLNYFICDLGGEAFRVIDILKRSKAKVICTLNFKPPSTNVFAQLGKEAQEKAEKTLYPKNISMLSKAGIPFSFSSLGTDDPKSFIEGVKKAIKNGLSKEKAIRALTRSGAEFLNLKNALGTIEKGKIANLIVTEGPLFDKTGKIKYVFADGKKYDMKKQTSGKVEKPTVNVTGKWEFSVQGMKLSLHFTQEGAALSGKLGSPFGVFEFSEGVVSGNQVSFDMSISVGGRTMDLYFTAEVEGNKMEGSILQGTQGSVAFNAKKTPQGGVR